MWRIEYPAHDDTARSLWFCGLWLAAIGALCALVPFGLLPRAIGAVAGAIGLCSALFGDALGRRCRRWLSDVCSGKVKDWSIVRDVDTSDLDAAIPLRRRAFGDFSAVLVVTPHGAARPYHVYRSKSARTVALLSDRDVAVTGTADTPSS